MEAKKRKILFVITKSNWGGAQRYVYDLATCLAGRQAALPKEKFDVAVVLGGTGEKNAEAGKLLEKLREKNIRTIFVKSFMRDISIFHEFSAFFELMKIFKEENPDVVHLNSSKAGGVGALAARFAGRRSARPLKIIFTSHGLVYDEDRNPFARGAIFLATWLTFLLCHKVIVITKDSLRRASRLPFCKKKIALIHNGIGPMAFGGGEAIRKAFPSGAFITGTIGELTHNKNQKKLVEMARQDQGMNVAIVGEGEDRAMLEGLIRRYGLESRVKLFGFVPASEALLGFDRFALVSVKEGLPYVLLEARQAGLPIVADRVGGVGDILDSRDAREFSLERMVGETMRLYT